MPHKVTENEIKRRFPYASKSTIARNVTLDNQAPSPKPKQTVCDDTVGSAPRKEGNPGRVAVRITSFRRRLLDFDNLFGGTKYFTDGLRYAGLISNDAEAQIRLEVRQQKVESKADECTLIEIEPLLLPATPAQPAQPASVPAGFSPTESVSGMTRPHLVERFWAGCSKTWNRQAFNAFMETLSDDDLRHYVTHGLP